MKQGAPARRGRLSPGGGLYILKGSMRMKRSVDHVVSSPRNFIRKLF